MTLYPIPRRATTDPLPHSTDAFSLVTLYHTEILTSLRGNTLGKNRHPNPSIDRSNSTKGGAPTITGWKPSLGVVMVTRLWILARDRDPPNGMVSGVVVVVVEVSPCSSGINQEYFP